MHQATLVKQPFPNITTYLTQERTTLTGEIAGHRTVDSNWFSHNSLVDWSEGHRLRDTYMVDQAVLLVCFLKVRRDGFLILSEWKPTSCLLCRSNTFISHLA